MLAPAPSYTLAPSPPDPLLPPPVQTEPREVLDPRVGDDANADHVFILPTAYTHPKGTFYFSSTEIVLLQAGYAFTDNAQVTLTATPPLSEDILIPIDVSVKVALVQDPIVRAAFIGSVTGLLGLDEGNFVIGRFTGTTQLCFSRACHSSITMAATMVLAGPGTLMGTGAGLTLELTDWLKLLTEVDWLIPLGAEVGEFNGLAAIGGFRFPWKRFALDIGAAVPLSTSDTPAVLPVLIMTYRHLP